IRGSGADARLVAYVVGEVDVSRVREAVAQRLPAYMVPSFIVRVEELPLTRNGKLDVARLIDPEHVISRDAYVEPRTARERALAHIWASVLHAERIGVDDDLAELGATSLAVVRAAHFARRELGIDIPVQLLFAERTIAGQARAIEQIGAADAS